MMNLLRLPPKELYRRVRGDLVAFRMRRRFRSVGRNLYIGHHSYFVKGFVSVGDHVFIGAYCYFACPVEIGNFVQVASYVGIVGGDHRIDLPGVPIIYSGRDERKTVYIEDDAWIGLSVVVMHGVRIGEGAVVAAGAVVTHDIPPYTIAAGVPAKVIRPRFDEAGIELHRQMLTEYRQTHKLDPTWRKVSR